MRARAVAWERCHDLREVAAGVGGDAGGNVGLRVPEKAHRLVGEEVRARSRDAGAGAARGEVEDDVGGGWSGRDYRRRGRDWCWCRRGARCWRWRWRWRRRRQADGCGEHKPGSNDDQDLERPHSKAEGYLRSAARGSTRPTSAPETATADRARRGAAVAPCQPPPP